MVIEGNIRASRSLPVIPKTYSGNVIELAMPEDWPGAERQLCPACHALAKIEVG